MVKLTPPDNTGNYVPVIARPMSTWDTIPILFYNNGYFLHAKGSNTQSYVVTWIVSI